MVSQKARIFPNKIERCTLAPSEPPTPAPSRHSWKEVTHGCSGRAKARLPGAQAFVHLSERLDGLPSTLRSSRAVHCPLSFQPFTSLPHKQEPCVLVHLYPAPRAVTQTALRHPLPLWVLLSGSLFPDLSWVMSSSRVLHPPYQTLSFPRSFYFSFRAHLSCSAAPAGSLNQACVYSI